MTATRTPFSFDPITLRPRAFFTDERDITYKLDFEVHGHPAIEIVEIRQYSSANAQLVSHTFRPVVVEGLVVGIQLFAPNGEELEQDYNVLNPKPFFDYTR